MAIVQRHRPALCPLSMWPPFHKPFENVHFVDTATVLEWKGYMEGAIRSGERHAAEVIAVRREGH